MLAFLGLFSFMAFVAFLITVIINAVKKQPIQKSILFIMASCFVVFVICIASSSSIPTSIITPTSTGTASTPATTATPSAAMKATQSDLPEIIVAAKTLAKAFDDNEIKANQDYRDKLAEITGTIDNIGETFGSTYIVLSAEKDFALTNVQCYFDDEKEINKIASLSKGSKVTVIGKIDGKSFNVSVNKCKFK